MCFDMGVCIKEPKPILPQESLAQLLLIWPRRERNGKASPQESKCECLWVTDQCVQTSNCSLLLDVHNQWLLICGSYPLSHPSPYAGPKKHTGVLGCGISRTPPDANLIVCESVCLSFPHCFSILSQGLEIQSTQILANGTQTEKQPAVGSILLSTIDFHNVLQPKCVGSSAIGSYYLCFDGRPRAMTTSCIVWERE